MKHAFDDWYSAVVDSHIGMGDFYIAIGDFYIAIGEFYIAIGEFYIAVGEFYIAVGEFYIAVGACKVLCVNVPGYGFGILSSKSMVKRPIAAFQALIGWVHFFVMFFIARKSSLKIASSLGKDPRVFVTFLRDMFSDSIVLVV